MTLPGQHIRRGDPTQATKEINDGHIESAQGALAPSEDWPGLGDIYGGGAGTLISFYYLVF